jgi:hypothetical protein
MHRTEGMVKTRMHRARIYQVRKSELLDIPQTLNVRMLNQFKNQLRRYGYEPVNGIIDDLFPVQGGCGVSLQNC